MSGSPVIARREGGYITSDGNQNIGPGLYSRFLGIYSGRYVGDDLGEMQLGIVWHANLLDEILEHGVAGNPVLK